MSTKPVAKILSRQDSALNSLLEHAQYLQQLTQALRDSLDTHLAAHVTIANLREQTAVIITDTPVWLTQLRYQAPTILRLLKTLPGLQKLQKVQFKIQPASFTPPPAPPRRANLSATSAHFLESAASDTKDPRLAEALYRLSRHQHTDEP
ncbi:MAG TPA: DUF721 domain-containing protein [Gammaproteobacteria bacterium]|nr:DUF721 domain-containing protein [Gammaproteobacteria bacterium]